MKITKKYKKLLIATAIIIATMFIALASTPENKMEENKTQDIWTDPERAECFITETPSGHKSGSICPPTKIRFSHTEANCNWYYKNNQSTPGLSVCDDCRPLISPDGSNIIQICGEQSMRAREVGNNMTCKFYSIGSGYKNFEVCNER